MPKVIKVINSRDGCKKKLRIKLSNSKSILVTILKNKTVERKKKQRKNKNVIGT